MKLECFKRVMMKWVIMMAVNLMKLVIDFDLKFILPIYFSKGFIEKLILNSHFDHYFHRSSFLVKMLIIQDLKYLNGCL
jgi:hypothetical protein